MFALGALLLTPYLFRELGTAGFGTWSVMFTLATVFSLLELGFATGVTKYVAELRARGDREQLQLTLGTAVTLLAALGTLAFGLSATAAVLFDGLADESLREAFRDGMLLLGAIMPLRFAGTAYATALIGYGRYDRFNVGQGVLAVGFPVAAVVVTELGGGIVGLAAAYAGALAAESALGALLLRRTDPGLSLRPRLGTRVVRRRLSSFGSFTLLAESMVFVGARMDTVLIAAILSAAAAAPFAAALKLQSGLQALALPFINLLMPMVSELWARGERPEARRRVVLTTRVALQVTLPVGLGLALFAPDVVDLWLGSNAPSETATIIVLLAAAQIVTLTVRPSEKALVGLGRVRVIGLLSLFEGAANVGMTIWFVSTMGATGAALATLLSYAALSPVRIPLAARALGISAVEFVQRGIGPAVLASLPAVSGMLALVAWMDPGAGRAVAGLGIGVALSVAVGLSQVGPRRLGVALREAMSRSGSSDPYPAEA